MLIYDGSKCFHYVRDGSDVDDPVLEVALHLSTQAKQPAVSDDPKYYDALAI